MSADADDAREKEKPAGPRLHNVGGTKGGMAEFFIGLAMLVAGGYLFLDNVIVTSEMWHSFRGFSSFGLTLLPIFVGICFLFFDGKSIVGWLMTGGGAVIIFVGVLARLNIWFRPTSLLNTILILALMAGGIGLIARAVRAH